jgi:hypothetical protein
VELREDIIRYVPVADLWLKHSNRRELQAVLVFRGYIDESHDDDLVPKVFNLSCLIAYDNMWPWFEMAWVKVLEEKNAELKSQNRKQLSRYHAADCSSRKNEFEGWSTDEQIEFSLKLFDVFRKHPVHFHGYGMPLQLMVQEIPETASNPVGFAYVILLTMLIAQINEKTMNLYPNDKISLHHDHCDYDGALADTFGQLLEDENFNYSDRFLSITPEYWQNSVMLQPADMIAYENFKEGMRHQYPNPKVKGRRKSLTALLDLDSVSAKASGFNLETIQDLKTIVGGLDSKTKKRLFDAARIKP